MMMTSPARRVVLELLRRVQHGAFASSLLSTTLNEQPFSLQDKSFITDLFYGTLRYQRYLNHQLKPYLTNPGKLPDAILYILQLGSYEILIRGTPMHAAVNEWVKLSKSYERKKYAKLSGLVNAVLRKLEGPLDEVALLDAAPFSVPDWLFEDWQKLFADKAKSVALAMNQPEPLWLYSYHAEAKVLLEAEGVKVEVYPFDERCLAVQSPKPLDQLKAYQQGKVQAQNPASAAIVSMLDPQKGERILDLCSGNGIKAAQMLARAAQVISVELSEQKIKRAEANLQRLGFQASHLVHDLTVLPGLEPAMKVLLDAPCSGTGTLRGHPEIRARLEPKHLKNLVELQSQLLVTAAQLTQTGGLLIYAVCALTSAEGVEVVESFLQTHPHFKALPVQLPIEHQATASGSYLLPFQGLDGFFIAKLQRVA